MPNGMLTRILFLVVTYLFTSIPFGVVLTRLVGKTDVRRHGSGNIGATNVARVLGKKWGIVVLFLDALKGFAMVKLALSSDDLLLVQGVAIISLVGHCFPVYLAFKGGKGVATGLGVIAAASLPLLGVCLGVFALVFALKRIVSLASLSAATAFALANLWLPSPLSGVTGLILAGIIVTKHSENIRRLMAGTEPQFR